MGCPAQARTATRIPLRSMAGYGLLTTAAGA